MRLRNNWRRTLLENLPDHLNKTEELYIIGEVQAIYFSNASNYYKVILVEVEETNAEHTENNIVITGNFGRIQEGGSYQFFGSLTNHPKYGVQFTATRYEMSQPTSSKALISYLSSDSFKGIGIKSAERIVDRLGADVIDLIVEDPKVLDKVPELSQKQKEVIEEVLATEYGMQKVILSLNKFGIANTLAFRIYGKYEERTNEVIRENPYQLIQDIEGMGFKRADMIAEHLDISPDDPREFKQGFYMFCIHFQIMQAIPMH